VENFHIWCTIQQSLAIVVLQKICLLVAHIHFYERYVLLWMSGDLKSKSEIKKKA